MAAEKQDLLRKIPPVDALLQNKELAPLAEKCPSKVITDAARSAAENIRRLILDGAQISLTEDNIQQTIVVDIVKSKNPVAVVIAVIKIVSHVRECLTNKKLMT